MEEKPKLTCGHNATNNFSFHDGEKKIVHLYCTTCGAHHYKGKEYTSDEWETWINTPDPETGYLCK